MKRLASFYLAVVLPSHPLASRKHGRTEAGVTLRVKDFQAQLSACLRKYQSNYEGATRIVEAITSELPVMAEHIVSDASFALREDPASKTIQEIVSTYPFILAIAVHRLAHELFRLGTPILPRSLSEFAHASTAIDIHPGAKIGTPFFIDHGTGVVIGETAEIGERVCVYHGVTLGALSFKRDDSGSVVKGEKRHPTINDGVILYSGCVILGGKTVIGADSVIGSNVWITESVPSQTIVHFDPARKTFAKRRR